MSEVVLMLLMLKVSRHLLMEGAHVMVMMMSASLRLSVIVKASMGLDSTTCTKSELVASTLKE